MRRAYQFSRYGYDTIFTVHGYERQKWDLNRESELACDVRRDTPNSRKLGTWIANRNGLIMVCSNALKQTLPENRKTIKLHSLVIAFTPQVFGCPWSPISRHSSLQGPFTFQTPSSIKLPNETTSLSAKVTSCSESMRSFPNISWPVEGHGRLGEGTTMQFRLRSKCDRGSSQNRAFKNAVGPKGGGSAKSP